MKRLLSWQVGLSVALISLSAFVYYIHYLLFRDAHHILIYLVGDLGVVFVEVLLVTIIIDELLGLREKQALLQKLNMVIGAFFSEVGLTLLRMMVGGRRTTQAMGQEGRLVVSGGVDGEGFRGGLAASGGARPCDHPGAGDPGELEERSWGEEGLPAAAAGEPEPAGARSFTNLLWAVFHVTEELPYRPSVEGLTGRMPPTSPGTSSARRAAHLRVAELSGTFRKSTRICSRWGTDQPVQPRCPRRDRVEVGSAARGEGADDEALDQVVDRAQVVVALVAGRGDRRRHDHQVEVGTTKMNCPPYPQA